MFSALKLKGLKYLSMSFRNFDQIVPKVTWNWVKNGHFCAIFRYRRIGRLGRIFGTEYSAVFDRIFGRIFGIGRTLSNTHCFNAIVISVWLFINGTPCTYIYRESWKGINFATTLMKLFKLESLSSALCMHLKVKAMMPISKSFTEMFI